MNFTQVVAPIAFATGVTGLSGLTGVVGVVGAEATKHMLTRGLVALASMVLLPQLATVLGSMVPLPMLVQPISTLSVPVYDLGSVPNTALLRDYAKDITIISGNNGNIISLNPGIKICGVTATGDLVSI
jgi:hypothetical protein